MTSDAACRASFGMIGFHWVNWICMKFGVITGITCEITMFIRTILMLINQWI